MAGRASTGGLQTACGGCALRTLCEASDAVPGGTAPVESRALERGQALFAPGDAHESLHAVRAGFIKVSAPVGGEPRAMRFLMPGDALGLESFAEGRHACAAVALETSVVCSLPIRRVQLISESFPRVSIGLRSLLAREGARAALDAVALLHRSAPQRLAHFLLDFGRRWAERGYSAQRFRLPMERREIADALGLSLETVSRTLAEFRALGWVAITGRHVLLREPVRLAACPRLLERPVAR